MQYVLYVKSTAVAPFVESDPAKSEVFEIKEAGTEPDNVVILLDLSNADTYPTDFPKSSSSNVKTYEGIFGGYNFKFSCNTAVYFSSSSSPSYLMIGKSGTTDQTASKIQFPAISGLKLTKVVIKSSSGTSTNVKSSIANLSGTTLSGGESWTFVKDTEHTYTLLDTAPNTSYQLYILSTKSTYNAQLVKLELTYEK